MTVEHLMLRPEHCDRLMRKSEMLEIAQISKSTLHAKLDPRSPYHDPSIPRPRYLERSRIPLWSKREVDEWLSKLFDHERAAGSV